MNKFKYVLACLGAATLLTAPAFATGTANSAVTDAANDVKATFDAVFTVGIAIGVAILAWRVGKRVMKG